MKCTVCNTNKPNYHFFNFRGKYNRDFFAQGIPQSSTVCFACAGDYRCLGCGEVKPHTEFRVQGRFCKQCREQSNLKFLSDKFTRNESYTVDNTYDDETGAETA